MKASISLEMRPPRSVRSPDAWYDTFPTPRLASDVVGRAPALIKRFTDIPGNIDQPPLNAHVVALHLGGAKRVRRTQGKRTSVQDVALGSMTLMPAYQSSCWHTEGPIDFAHVTLSVGTAEEIVVEEFDREPATHQLYDTIGVVDPLLEQLFLAMLAQLERKPRRRLHTDCLMTVFAVSLLERHSTLAARRTSSAQGIARRRGGLAGWQLRRAIDHMHDNMHADLALSALAGLTGLSRAHFFRAFRQSTGQSPGQFLAHIRMRHAMLLLETSALHIDEVATALGFTHARHFASAFTKRVGVSPRLFRASRQ